MKGETPSGENGKESKSMKIDFKDWRSEGTVKEGLEEGSGVRKHLKGEIGGRMRMCPYGQKLSDYKEALNPTCGREKGRNNHQDEPEAEEKGGRGPLLSRKHWRRRVVP